MWTDPQASFRKSPAFQSNPGAVAVWLRRAELEAMKLDLPIYRKDLLKSKLAEIRGLSLQIPVVYLRRLVELCAECGVALVYMPEIKGGHVSGAARWLTPTKPMIVLSLRYKKDDRFWFSLLHEIAHILKHGKKQVFIDDGQASEIVEEREADLFARHTLIPPEYDLELQRINSRDEILDLAKRIGVAPGIVVGRLQWDRDNYKILNGLKQDVDFDIVEQSMKA